jgi:hypothetical protein
VKIQITFKNPDAIDEAFRLLEPDDADEAREVAEKWFEYGEYVTIELDTKKGTAEVVPV